MALHDISAPGWPQRAAGAFGDPRDVVNGGAQGGVDGGADGAAEAAYAAVASILWREREVLERVLFKLTCQQLILRGGEIRWLSPIDDEVRHALSLLKDCEVLRAVEVNELAVRLGVSPDTSLRELAAAAPEPWSTLLTDHREALLTLTGEISATTAENRRILQAGAAAASESLAGVPGATSTYGADGHAVAGTAIPIMFDHRA